MNYFLVNGILNKPHLLETYNGLTHKRVLADINDDEFPDYYEFRFRVNKNGISVRDSIPFYWDIKKEFYITNSNKFWKRKY